MSKLQKFKAKLRMPSIKTILHVIVVEVIVNAIWVVLAKFFVENPLIKDIGFLVLSVLALFALAWYLGRRSSVQSINQNISPVSEILNNIHSNNILDESPSWEQVYFGVEQLSVNIKKEYQPDIIVGISSGGAIVAGMLSKILNKPLTTIVRSNPRMEETIPTESAIIFFPTSIIRGKRILLVDDVVRSGKTLLDCYDEIKQRKQKPTEVKSATFLIAGEHLITKPDYFAYRANRIEVRMPWDHAKMRQDIIAD